MTAKGHPKASDVVANVDVDVIHPASITIYAWLRQSILNGNLPPGALLRQEALAKRFDVSRVPVREAMNRLLADGLIVLRPRRGFAVVSLDRAEIAEIFELRMVVEEHAMTVATRSRTQEDVEAVTSLLARMDRTDPGAPGYFTAWGQLNREFHERMVASARRQRLSEVSRNLRDAVEPYILLESRITGQFDDAAKEHQALLSAFREGHAVEAGWLSRQHCAHTLERLLAGLTFDQAGQVKATAAPVGAPAQTEFEIAADVID